MRQFFEDDSGQLSLMRLMSLIALGVAIWLSWYAVTNGTEKQSFTIIATWVVGAFAPKAIQKLFEDKTGISIPKPKIKNPEV